MDRTRVKGLRRVLWHRLNNHLTRSAGSDWSDRTIVIYGAGGLGRSFLQTFPNLKVAYAVDSSPATWGEDFCGLEVRPPEALHSEPLDEILVFITSSWHEEIRRTLESMGLELHRQIFFGNQQAHGRIFFYLRDMDDFRAAFSWFDERGTVYSILRWFETLPEERPADIDLLVRTDDLESLFENPYLTSDPVGVPLEVYWSEPLGQEDELLYYPSWLAREILSRRERRASGAYSPSDENYLKSLAYHVVFHKAERSQIPFDEKALPAVLPNKYAEKLLELASARGVEIEVTLEGLWRYLESVSWLPPVDLARRYAVDLKSAWLMEQVGGGQAGPDEILVFVFREWLIERPEILKAVLAEIESLDLRPIEFVELAAVEKKNAKAQIRGGNWFETEGSRVGGGPAAFGVYWDPKPMVPSDQDRLLRPFCQNQKLTEKTGLKQRVCQQFDEPLLVNFLHAADDEREGLEYLSCLEPERLRRMHEKIDAVKS